MASSVESTQKSLYIGHTSSFEKTDGHIYRFPADSFIRLNSHMTVDVSEIQINLSDIFIGGIGYGGGASKLLATTMQAIGSEGCVHNTPFCIEGYSIVSTEDEIVSKEIIQKNIDNAIKAGFTHINIPLNLNGHASLLTLVVLSDTAVLRFYDSLSPDIQSYDGRYNRELIECIQSFLPPSIVLSPEKPEVLHLFSQGGADSSGCGYYALYTALRLKEDEAIRSITSFNERPLLDETADKKIRAELVLRSMLVKGVDNIDTSFTALCSQRRDHLYNRIGFAVKSVIQQLKLRDC